MHQLCTSAAAETLHGSSSLLATVGAPVDGPKAAGAQHLQESIAEAKLKASQSPEMKSSKSFPDVRWMTAQAIPHDWFLAMERLAIRLFERVKIFRLAMKLIRGRPSRHGGPLHSK